MTLSHTSHSFMWHPNSANMYFTAYISPVAHMGTIMARQQEPFASLWRVCEPHKGYLVAEYCTTVEISIGS